MTHTHGTILTAFPTAFLYASAALPVSDLGLVLGIRGAATAPECMYVTCSAF